ncbi:hypothetical protein O181_043979 [Austropuccinia psidii MF-1]|uniref:Uncharacterized protein n=1 Tax=Austropuccinia psidii MF-1 TaxID=1389203 RepID=A0A9Q3HIZ1_9BASI|nr:hypothetical protein [Austropuccinia psidii MF-1]
MELIDYIDGLFIDVPRIPDYWITARLNKSFKGHASIWYTEMKAIHCRRSRSWWKNQIIQKYRNGTWIWQRTISFENYKYSVDKDPYEWCLSQSKIIKAIDPQTKNSDGNQKLLTQILGELEHAVKCRCNPNCTLDDFANTLQDAKKKVYAIGKVLEEESPTKDSESESVGYAIREQFDDGQDPREELIVEYQEEKSPKIQDIQLKEGMPQETEDKNLCKHTQISRTLLVTLT